MSLYSWLMFFCLDSTALFMLNALLVWSNPNQSNRRSSVQWYFPLWFYPARKLFNLPPESTSTYVRTYFEDVILQRRLNRRTSIDLHFKTDPSRQTKTRRRRRASYFLLSRIETRLVSTEKIKVGFHWNLIANSVSSAGQGQIKINRIDCFFKKFDCR